ncbi:MAG: ATP-binding protein [Succinivibrio sp.]|nr:ATP-binding protein [Succinivibrio sp.]
MITSKLKTRPNYLNKLIGFKDTEPVKVITGIRRCGKSSLLKLMIEHLKQNGVLPSQILYVNFESFEYVEFNSTKLYNYVKERIVANKRMYLFFDEVQRVKNWENAINAFRVDFNCDIYITGSNAYLLSSEYATYLSGRCVEIKMLPLSFVEFIDFNDLTLKTEVGALGDKRTYAEDSSGSKYPLKEVFNSYLKFGGMPGITELGLDQEKSLMLLDSVFSTIIVRDILDLANLREKGPINDSVLLKKIVMFLSDNIGNNVSLSSIGNTLSNEGLLEDVKTKGKVSVHKLQYYVNSLLESFFFYEIKRFDIKGKEYLKTLGKYYIVDLGFRNLLLGYRNRDIGHVLENIVYLELLRRGYDVAIGKIDNLEIDFIAQKADEKLYIQVTDDMSISSVTQRELAPLKKVKDNYPKIVLALNLGLETNYDGIKILNVIDWLVASKDSSVSN